MDDIVGDNDDDNRKNIHLLFDGGNNNSNSNSENSNDNDDDDDDDDSFVPDSLREFLAAADQKLDDDLAGFLISPPAKTTILNDDDDDSVDDCNNNSTTAANNNINMQQSNTKKKRNEVQCENSKDEDDNDHDDKLVNPLRSLQHDTDNNDDLLDILHPSADVTESHVKRIAMEGVDESTEEENVKLLRSSILSESASESASASASLFAVPPIPLSPMIHSGNTNTTNMNTKILSGLAAGDSVDLPSSSSLLLANKKVGRKLQMELDREAQRSSLLSPAPTPAVVLLSSTENNNNDDDDNSTHNTTGIVTSTRKKDNIITTIVDNDSHNTKQKILAVKQNRLKELKTKCTERRSKIQEYDELKERRKSLLLTTNSESSSCCIQGNNSGDDNDNDNGMITDGNKTDIIITNDDESIRNEGGEDVVADDKIFVQKDAVAATETAIVTAKKSIIPVHNVNDITESDRIGDVGVTTTENQLANEIVTSDNVKGSRNSNTTNTKNKTKIKYTKNKRHIDPLKVTNQRRKPIQQHHQKRSFIARSAPSPPIPKELITTIKFFGNNDDRSVSPLGAERDFDYAVSPLRTVSSSTRNNGSKLRKSSGGVSLKQQQQQHQSLTATRRRPLTRPDGGMDRLLKPTSASNAQKIGTNKSKPLEAPRRIKRSPEEEQQKAKERIRARLHLQRKISPCNSKPIGRKSPRGTIMGRKSTEKKTKANATRERMQKIERERLEKLRAKINAKEERLQTKINSNNNKSKRAQQLLQRQQRVVEKVDSRSTIIRRKKPSPTIPIAPNFATDRRIHSKVLTPSSSAVVGDKKGKTARMSLASSGDIFSQGLRETSAKRTSGQWSNRPLTIPKAPKFSASKRYGDKSTPVTSPQRKKKDFIDDNMSWSSTLRDVSGISPISKAASSVKTGPLTIPITPQFQPIRKRRLPKSTSEKEEEEMQYYKDHPFKARLVKSSNSGPKSAPLKASTLTSLPRPVTTPVPFHFHSCKSKHKHHDKKDEVEKETTFKARSMPVLSSKNRPTSLKGKKSQSSTRPLTVVEPFKFYDNTRQQSNAKKDPKEEQQKGRGFRGLPSNRSSLRGTKSKSHTDTKKYSTKKLATTDPFHFTTKERAKNHTPITHETINQIENDSSGRRVIPSGSSGIPFIRTLTTTTTTATSCVPRHGLLMASGSPDAREKEPEMFRARCMPSFDKVSIPVQHRDPSKIRSPSPKKDEGMVSPEIKAKPIPNMLSQEPVKRRDSKKCRSPESVNKSSGSTAPVGEKKSPESFRALSVPSSLDDEPLIPVRHCNPNKLRSPDNSNQSSKKSSCDVKARLRERLSKKTNNVKKQTTNHGSSTTAVSKDSNPGIKMSPSHPSSNRSNKKTSNSTDTTPVKSNTIPRSSSNSRERRNRKSVTPQSKDTNKNTRSGGDKNDHTTITTAATNNAVHADQEACLEREAKLACVFGQPDEDESSSVLQLAKEIQRAAETELSYIGSSDTGDNALAFS